MVKVSNLIQVFISDFYGFGRKKMTPTLWAKLGIFWYCDC